MLREWFDGNLQKRDDVNTFVEGGASFARL